MVVLAGHGDGADAQTRGKIDADRRHAEPAGEGGCRGSQQQADEDQAHHRVQSTQGALAEPQKTNRRIAPAASLLQALRVVTD